jgi:hypothetical protein
VQIYLVYCAWQRSSPLTNQERLAISTAPRTCCIRVIKRLLGSKPEPLNFMAIDDIHCSLLISIVLRLRVAVIDVTFRAELLSDTPALTVLLHHTSDRSVLMHAFMLDGGSSVYICAKSSRTDNTHKRALSTRSSHGSGIYSLRSSIW